MTQPQWNADDYITHAAFVAEAAGGVVGLLNPQAQDKILDIGCGDGALTAQLQQYGCTVVGIDASPNMIARARQRGLTAFVQDACALSYQQEFTAVFSNAVLHWIHESDKVLQGIYRALMPGGRFAAEFGGAGDIAALVWAMEDVFKRHPDWGGFINPWYFPHPDEYRHKLEQAGFQVKTIQLIPRPTPLNSGIRKWLEIFADGITRQLNAAQKAVFLDEMTACLRPHLYCQDQGWVADYVRLRVLAVKP
ncbi:class I SAM-dependent methyltransferase [Methylovulum psychrotolerans]|jgi:2-isopropylmalate synthase|uniref:SAM-dependent methyltransferase n=1 Tax=Methylovulum psychrotolerans TaxID=1704499 RepID=A0A1Z4BU78_9GAMM|nr:class I SAM-dependent methyltransferase [Methylovulum psychrotolerans]ASF44759.1 SAM-dependent methyltransferase [Methylovulum psychrotolerans]